jgi:hypothetical protein
MSALGQKQTSEHVRVMSALAPKADIGTQPRDVCFVPEADSCAATKTSLFDHFISSYQHVLWERNTEGLGGLQVYH